MGYRREDVAERRKKLAGMFSAEEYYDALLGLNVHSDERKALEVHYNSPNRTITMTEMSNQLGHSYITGANLKYGYLGRRLQKQLGLSASEPYANYWIEILVDFHRPNLQGTHLQWIMRPQVAQALEMLGWVQTSEHSERVIPEEIEERNIYEGAKITIEVNRYERSSEARELCIRHYGYACSVCGLSLGSVYGEVAKDRIHVHHLTPLSEIDAEYMIDGERDLRPVCPTCHYVIHLRKPPYTVDKLRQIMAAIGQEPIY